MWAVGLGLISTIADFFGNPKKGSRQDRDSAGAPGAVQRFKRRTSSGVRLAPATPEKGRLCAGRGRSRRRRSRGARHRRGSARSCRESPLKSPAAGPHRRSLRLWLPLGAGDVLVPQLVDLARGAFRSRLTPVVDAQPRDSDHVIDVGGDERRIERERMCRDCGIEILNPRAPAFQGRFDAAERLADGIGPLGSCERITSTRGRCGF